MEKIHWAPKVRQAKIWQLYQNDALGVVDEDLVAEVGFALFQRCQSIRQVTHGAVECPRCGAVFGAREGGWYTDSGMMECPTAGCGWQTTREEWHKSWQHQDLNGAKAIPALEEYLQKYPLARTVEEQTFCIDRLIHAFHWDAQLDLPNRSFANNLIQGSLKQVIELLDRLSAIDPAAKEEWRETIQIMWQRRRGKV